MSTRTTSTKSDPAPSTAPEPSKLARIVDAWFVQHFHNRGLDTPEFNRLSAARDELKARLERELAEE